MKTAFLRLLLLFILIGANLTGLFAQLDTIHWIPPMYPGNSMGEQFVDLTTPEIQPFAVTIVDGAGTLVKIVMVSKAQPYRYKLSNTYSQLILPDIKLQQVLKGFGLVLHGPKPFHAAFHLLTEDEQDAVYIPCKGRTALGQVFRIGHMRQVTDKTGQRFNMIGIMATENGTSVTLSGFDPTLAEFGGGAPVTVALQCGETIVYSHYIGGIGDDQPRNGFMGALLTSSKPIVVSSGSWMGAPVIYQTNNIGVDQILPLQHVGKQYIFCMGNGPTTLEHPIMVAHTNDTKVWINDAVVPDTVLQAGQYYVIEALYYLPRGNMSVRTSQPVFAYQMTGGIKTGSYSLGTSSLMVVPPINCGLPTKLDNLYLPNRVNDTRFDGGLMIVAQRGATITVKVNGDEEPIGDPVDVPGNPDFVTYRAMSFFSHIYTVTSLTVESTSSMQVSMVMRWEGASYAALFSGPVLRKPEVHLTLKGDGICPDTLLATGVFDGIQWVYDDSLFQEGPSPRLKLLAPGNYKAIAYLNGCRETATVADSLQVPLTAPQFPYTTEQPSCFDYSDGQIVFGTPNGGDAPYRYSIDFGQHFSGSAFFDNVHAGKHKLVVQDASGCYNQPIHVNMGQPDSVYVNLFFRYLPDPLRPREEVALEGSTGGNFVAATAWNPPDSSDCPDCLVHKFRPEKSTWVTLTVHDAAGCPGSDSILVLVQPPVFAPNVIHPGSTSGNGIFSLYSEHNLPVQQLMIFSRWGEVVFEKHNFLTNNPADGWTGTFRGKPVAPGVYIFIAKVEIEPGRMVDVQGDIMVVE